MLRRRQAWFDGQLELNPERLVFIDETWASTNMARTHGRAPRGRRLRAGAPHGHWKTTTFTAGLRSTGLIAPFVLDGPINREAFEVYVERVIPSLVIEFGQRYPMGDARVGNYGVDWTVAVLNRGHDSLDLIGLRHVQAMVLGRTAFRLDAGDDRLTLLFKDVSYDHPVTSGREGPRRGRTNTDAGARDQNG